MQHNSDTTFAQPNSDITSKFDDFLLLSRGKTVYNGPWDKSVEYFTQQGYRYVCIAPLQSPWTLHTIHLPHHSCPQYTNPTDYYLSLVKDEATTETLANKYTTWQQQQQQHLEHHDKTISAGASDAMSPIPEGNGGKLKGRNKSGRTSVLFQTVVLSQRYVSRLWRQCVYICCDSSETDCDGSDIDCDGSDIDCDCMW